MSSLYRIPRGRSSTPYPKRKTPPMSILGEVNSALFLDADGEDRHLALLFYGLQLYALYNVYFGHWYYAFFVAIPALLIPYALGPDEPLTILGFPFWLVLPTVTKYYPESRWDTKHSKWYKGPARDVYASAHYFFPLYLALWYAGLAFIPTAFHPDKMDFGPLQGGPGQLGMFTVLDEEDKIDLRLPGNPVFLTLASILFVSTPYYWRKEASYENHKERKYFAFSLPGRLFVMFCAVSIWIFLKDFILHIDENEYKDTALYSPVFLWLFFIQLKVVKARFWGTSHWRRHLFMPYSAYWERSATREDVVVWEMLREKNESGQRRATSHGRVKTKAAKLAYVESETESEEPLALYRAESDESSGGWTPPHVTTTGSLFRRRGGCRCRSRVPKEPTHTLGRGFVPKTRKEFVDTDTYHPSYHPTGTRIPFGEPESRAAARAAPPRPDEERLRGDLNAHYTDTFRNRPRLADRKLQHEMELISESLAPASDVAQKRAKMAEYARNERDPWIAELRTGTHQPRRLPERRADSIKYSLGNTVPHQGRPGGYLSVIEDQRARYPPTDEEEDDDDRDPYTLHMLYPLNVVPARGFKESIDNVLGGIVTVDQIISTCFYFTVLFFGGTVLLIVKNANQYLRYKDPSKTGTMI